MSALIAIVLASAPLRFDEALALADRSPLAVSSKRATERRREVSSSVSALVANPSITVQPGYRGSSLGGGLEMMGSVALPLNLSGLGGARRETVGHELAHERLWARATLHSVRLTTAGAWLQLWAAQGVLEEARREFELARALGERFERAARSGAVTKVDSASMRAWVAEAQLAVLTAEGEAFEAGVQLNRALGRDASSPASADAQLPEVPVASETALSQSLASAERSPSAELARASVEVEEARVKETLASKGSWLQVGIAGGREGSGDLVALGTLGLTLPTFERGEREAAPLVAAAARSEGDRQVAIAEARAQHVQVVHELEHTRETLEVLEQALVPATEEAALGVQRRLEGGESTVQELILARRAALNARSRKLRAQAAHALARFRAAEFVRMTTGESS